MLYTTDNSMVWAMSACCPDLHHTTLLPPPPPPLPLPLPPPLLPLPALACHRWFTQWCQYSGFTLDPSRNNKKPRVVALAAPGPRPGPIDNSDLVAPPPVGAGAGVWHGPAQARVGMAGRGSGSCRGGAADAAGEPHAGVRCLCAPACPLASRPTALLLPSLLLRSRRPT